MGHSKAQKARTHKRIVAIASKRFREKGLTGFGIAELMKEAGLTVGGFYKHFLYATASFLGAEAALFATPYHGGPHWYASQTGDKGRKRVLAIVAGILVARHLKTADDLFDNKPTLARV